MLLGRDCFEHSNEWSGHRKKAGVSPTPQQGMALAALNWTGGSPPTRLTAGLPTIISLKRLISRDWSCLQKVDDVLVWSR